MSTKSKHKSVTLAKSVANFDEKDLVTTVLDEAVEQGGEVVEAKSEKTSEKPAKATKTKANSASHGVADVTDVTAVYRTLADRTLHQAREAYSKVREDTLALSGKIEESSNALMSGTSAVQFYVVNAMQAQADDAFDYFRALADIKTTSDMIELQSAQSRKALDASLHQFKELSALMNDLVVKSATPIQSAFPFAKS